MASAAGAEIPVVAAALPEDLRDYLVQALPLGEEEALQDFGFERILDETPGLQGHCYLEGYFHALYEHRQERVLSAHPRNPFDWQVERHPAPAPIVNFCEAFRRRNRDGLESLASRLTGAGLEPLRQALTRGAEFADVSIQFHWGRSLPTEHAAWHVDACYSVLHLAVGLQGQRDLLARRQLQRDNKVERLPQAEGDVYLSAPFYFHHAVTFPAAEWHERVISMQCRLLLAPQDLTALQPELRESQSCFAAVMDYLAARELALPTLADVQAVAAESFCAPPSKTLPCSPPSTREPSTSSSQSPTGRSSQDREVTLTAMQQDGAALEFEDEDVKADHDAVLAAVTQHGPALQFAAAALREAPDIVLAALSHDVSLLLLASPLLLQQREFGMKAVASHPAALQHLCEELRGDKGVVMAAVRGDGLLLRFAESNLRADREIVVAAVEQNGAALRYAHTSLREDPGVLLPAVQHDPKLVRYACGSLKALCDCLLATTGDAVTSHTHAATQTSDDTPALAARAASKCLTGLPQSAPVGQCYLVGTWDEFTQRHPLLWDGKAYHRTVELAPGKVEESFQLLLGWWDRRLYPNIRDASPDRPHEVLGPDGDKERAHGKNWTVVRRGVGLQVRLCFEICMQVGEDGSFQVDWSRTDEAQV